MGKVYLYTHGEGWKPFDLSNKEEFKKRDIVIGDRVKIGYEVVIGYEAKIGNGVVIGNSAKIGYRAEIGDSAEIGNRAEIGDGVTIGNEAVIGNRAEIGDGVTIGNEAEIGDEVTIGNRVKIGYEAKIGNYAKIGNGATIKSLIFSGTQHVVSYWGEDRIDIGFKTMSIQEWINAGDDIGYDGSYTDEQIAEYRQYIMIIAELHKSQREAE
ncbi:acyl-ACP--UDP-N- acetylglucosamine O-acyltransferase [Leptospira santarosai]|uniref:acyl-ACP--UDP-N- acetylglucosamine O-acyltransferase n=1 Tax=Leptospira santarosai TaxID=28183 RepID=UPI0024AEC72C|nr:acyl-ACP--UDP-N- acetylglucosamine O-acyltransferase [Leptospira santarosai]MDI7165939.1 acyl-ACP--UDP-N- acetylglucosamine O-acyltransferase [Leptospira santarosai]